MSRREQRSDERFPCEIPVELVSNRERVRLITTDVSYRGVFLRTDAPPRLRQLLRLELTLPEGKVLKVHGMPVHLVGPGEGDRGSGVGVQFYAVDADTSATWGRFVDQVQRRARSLRRASVREAPSAEVSHVGPVGTAARQPEAELDLEVPSYSELLRLARTDVLSGAMRIATDAPLAAGARLRIHVHHPVHAGSFALDATVRGRGHDPPCLEVVFDPLDDARRVAFVAFVRVPAASPPPLARGAAFARSG